MSDSAEQSTPVFETKLACALHKGGREALEPFSEAFFTDRGGEWVAVVRLTHKERTERVKTEGEYDYVQKTAILRIEDLEVMPEEDSHAAYALMKRVRDARKAREDNEFLTDPDGLFGGETR